ncbi:MAG: proton-conducting transporter membrane subunit [Hymenobacter sp.]
MLAIIGIIYGAIIAIRQHDMKRLIAYSSLSHVGLMIAGVFSLTASWPARRGHPDAGPRRERSGHVPGGRRH